MQCPQRYKKCEETKGPCDDTRAITFWLDTKGRWKNCDMASDFYTMLVTNPLIATWAWLIAAVVSSVGWALLYNEGVFTAPINETAIRYSLYIIAGVGSVFYFIMSKRRWAMAHNFQHLCHATRGIMLGVQGGVVSNVVGSDASVNINSHNNNQFVSVPIKANLLPKRLAIVLNAILVARRRTMLNDLMPSKLPLYADQIAELCSTVGPACIDTLYAMVVHLLRVMQENGATSVNFDSAHALDHLHHAIHETGSHQPIPRIWLNAIFWTKLVLTVFIPLLFTRLYPGYSVVWIAPIVLNFYYAAMAYAVAQCDMMLRHTTNMWSDVPIARILNCTANDNYATAATIGRTISDIKSPEPAAAKQSPPLPPKGAGGGGGGGLPPPPSATLTFVSSRIPYSSAPMTV